MDFITAALAKGLKPHVSASDRLILRDGRKHRALVIDGRLTSAGAAYEARSGERLELVSLDTEQVPTRRGNVESIRQGVVRRYDVATGEWVYTALGRRFFARRRVEYVVQVPAVFSGTRSNGRAYERTPNFPSHRAAPQNLR